MFPAAHLLLRSKAAQFSKSVGLFINRGKLAPRSAWQLSDELLITDLTRAEREKLFPEVPGLPGNDEGRVPARQPLLPRSIWHLKAPRHGCSKLIWGCGPRASSSQPSSGSKKPHMGSTSWKEIPRGTATCSYLWEGAGAWRAGWTTAVPFVLPLPATPIFAVVNLCRELGVIKHTGVKTSLCELTDA